MEYWRCDLKFICQSIRHHIEPQIVFRAHSSEDLPPGYDWLNTGSGCKRLSLVGRTRKHCIDVNPQRSTCDAHTVTVAHDDYGLIFQEFDVFLSQVEKSLIK